MKKETEYQEAEAALRVAANWAKRKYGSDKPAIRMVINDACDSICKDLHLSDYHRGLLENYACTLHPKN